MKIRKFQNSGKLLKQVVEPIIESNIYGKVPGLESFFPDLRLEREVPKVLSSLVKNFGSTTLNPEQQQGVSDLANFLFKKDLYNLI